MAGATKVQVRGGTLFSDVCTITNLKYRNLLPLFSLPIHQLRAQTELPLCILLSPRPVERLSFPHALSVYCSFADSSVGRPSVMVPSPAAMDVREVFPTNLHSR